MIPAQFLAFLQISYGVGFVWAGWLIYDGICEWLGDGAGRVFLGGVVMLLLYSARSYVEVKRPTDPG